MKVISNGIQNGIIDDKYGKFGVCFDEDMPTFSLPFQIEDVPLGTQSFAVILDDKDAVEVAGFVWIHWLIANLTTPVVPSGASTDETVELIQGLNSWHKPCYGGMAPPNKPHTYDLIVYALDIVLPLQNGFTVEQLKHAMQGHILAHAQTHGIYRDK